MSLIDNEKNIDFITEANSAHSADVFTPTPEQEAQIEDQIISEKDRLQKWLMFRVKNEVVAHVFKAEDVNEPISISEVAEDVVLAELTRQRTEHETLADKLTELIPKAQEGTVRTYGTTHKYTKKDIPHLEMRTKIHKDMVDFVDEVRGEEGSDQVYELTDELIRAVKQDAYAEAIDELKAQAREAAQIKHEAEMGLTDESEVIPSTKEIDARDEKIAELQLTVSRLKTELATNERERADLHIQLWDKEFTPQSPAIPVQSKTK